MKLEIIGSVNSGVCIIFPDRKKVWIDFVHDLKTPLWPTVSDEMWETIKGDSALYPPDIVLFTHVHPDHYSKKKTGELLKDHPGTPVILPKGATYSSYFKREFSADDLSGADLVSGETAERTFGDLTVLFTKSLHSGKEYVDTPHYCIELKYKGKSIFISGDAKLSSEELCDRLEFVKADLAVMNFPWASVSKGREILSDTLKPSHLLLVHLPDQKDDPFHYMDSAENGAGLLDLPDIRLMRRPFQKEVFDL